MPQGLQVGAVAGLRGGLVTHPVLNLVPAPKYATATLPARMQCTQCRLNEDDIALHLVPASCPAAPQAASHASPALRRATSALLANFQTCLQPPDARPADQGR